MEESAKVLLDDSSISKFSPERFVFWNAEINRSGLKYAQFLLWRLFSPSWCILWFRRKHPPELDWKLWAIVYSSQRECISQTIAVWLNTAKKQASPRGLATPPVLDSQVPRDLHLWAWPGYCQTKPSHRTETAKKEVWGCSLENKYSLCIDPWPIVFIYFNFTYFS